MIYISFFPVPALHWMMVPHPLSSREKIDPIPVNSYIERFLSSSSLREKFVPVIIPSPLQNIIFGGKYKLIISN
jgi:hypothetical protein